MNYHYLYKITNLINNKIYIGVHSTNNLDDDYFGSGYALRLALKKHGKENPRARRCIVNTIEFDTISDVAKYLNISYPTMLSRLKSDKYTSINYLS